MGETALQASKETEALAARPSPGRLRRVGGLRVQRAAALGGVRVVPGLAAGVAAAVSSDRPTVGALVGAAVVVCATALERRHYPLHLMPIAGVIARHAAVVLGVGVAFVISLVFTPLEAEAVVWATVVGWTTLDVALPAVRALEQRLAARVAVIGSEGLVRALRGELAMAGISAFDVVGRIEAGSGLADQSGCAPLGWIDDLADVVERERIDLLVGGAMPSRRIPRLGEITARRMSEQVSACCLDLPVSYIGANEFFEELFAHVPLGTVDATWFEYVLHPRYRTASPRLKRTLGLLGATAILIVTLPLLAIAAAAIKMTDGGPILYRQRRAGERGREFDVLKLRTMRVADDPEDLPVAWSTSDDGRITKVGSLLRRTHLDELPQLWNVIRGEMALVGPRPERPDIVAMLEARLPFYGRRHLMRPGITGWAQVRCGYSASLAGSLWKLAHDLFYLKHGSAIFDLMIMFETLATPVRDARMARRSPDEMFVLEAIREEDETGEARASEPDLGIEVQRRRFRPRGERSGPDSGSQPFGQADRVIEVP